MKRRGRWVRVLAGALLLFLGRGAGAEEPDLRALGEFVRALPEHEVPLRLRVEAGWPLSVASRAEEHLPELVAVVRDLARSAGFVVYDDRPGLDSPLLELRLQGGAPAIVPEEAAPGRLSRLALVATVRGTLALTKASGPTWTVPLTGRSAPNPTAGGDSLSAAAYAAAVADTALLPSLLALVKARGRDPGLALLSAGEQAGPFWTRLILSGVATLDPASLARLCVAHLEEQPGTHPDVADVVLTWLGGEGREALLAAPAEGSVVYRWRRARALGDLSDAEAPDDRIASTLRAATKDEFALVRTAGLHALDAAEAARALPDLVEALADPQPCVAGHARLLLERRTKQRHGADPTAWRAWLQATTGAAGATLPKTVDALLLPFGLRPERAAAGAGPASASDPVARALATLLRLQRPEGTWPMLDVRFEAYEIGLTALGLLALQSAGHGAASPGALGSACRRAIQALRAAQGPDGHVGPQGQGCEAGHGLATLALLEAWAEQPGAALRQAAQAGLDWIARARNPYFGWRYGVRPGDNDSFVTSVMYLPLIAARAANAQAAAAGYDRPFALDEEAFDGIRAWCDKMTDPVTGEVGYFARGLAHPGYTDEPRRGGGPREPALTSTAAAVLWRVQDGATPKTDPRLALGLRRLSEHLPTWPPAGRQLDLLCWWFTGLAHGALPKEPQAKAFEPAVVGALRAALEAGTLTATDRWGWLGGDAYTSALAVLVLCARDFRTLPAPGRADLGRVVADAKAPAATRGRALSAWVRQAPALAAPSALTWLRGRDASLRPLAARALEARPELVVPALPALLKAAPTWTAGERAALVPLLGALGPKHPVAHEALLSALSDPAPAVRAAAAAAWPPGVEVPEPALPGLQALLASAEADVVRAALRLLLRPPVRLPLAALAPVLAHADPALRREALGALGVAQAAVPERLAALARVARDPEPAVRAAAALALGSVDSAEVQPLLVGLLSDPEEGVGRAACAGLAALALRHAPALEAVLTSLRAPAPLLRRRAAETLTRLGPAVAQVKPALHEAIKAEVGRGLERDLRVVLALAEARWAVTRDSTAVAGILQGVLTDEDAAAEVVVRTIELMGRLSEASDHEATAALLSEHSLGGPVGLAVLNAVADMGGRGLPYVDRLKYVVERWPESSELYAYAEVALRRVQAR